MATLEDKILGEKLHNYCSSSEESDNEDSGAESKKPNKASAAETKEPAEVNKWEGTSTNTGPKGNCIFLSGQGTLFLGPLWLVLVP